MTLDGDFTPEEFDKARRAEDTFAPAIRVDRDLAKDFVAWQGPYWVKFEEDPNRRGEGDFVFTNQRADASAEDTFAPVHVDAQVYRDLTEPSLRETVGIGYTLATGRLFCDISEFHGYAERLLNRPIMTHEFARPELWAEMRHRYETLVRELGTSKGPGGNQAPSTNPHSPARETEVGK